MFSLLSSNVVDVVVVFVVSDGSRCSMCSMSAIAGLVNKDDRDVMRGNLGGGHRYDGDGVLYPPM